MLKDVHQTREYAELTSVFLGGGFDSGDVPGGSGERLKVYYNILPLLDGMYDRLSVIRQPVNGLYRYVSWEHGPLAEEGALSPVIMGKLLDELISLRPGGVFRIGPVTLPLYMDNGAGKDLKEVFLSKGFLCKKWATYVIDLGKGLNTLWDGCEYRARKAVIRSQKLGVTARQSGETRDMEEYYRILAESRKRAALPLISRASLNKYWEYGRNKGLLTLHAAYRNGKMLSGMLITHGEGYMFECLLAQADADYREKTGSVDVLTWEAVKWGVENGYRYFDLKGVNPSPAKNSKDLGIRFFKEKWGGDYLEYDIFYYYFTGWRQALYKAYRKLFYGPDCVPV